MFTWLRDLLDSVPRYSLLQTLQQPFPEPSTETLPPFLPQPALIRWLRGPTTNVAGTRCGQAPHLGRGAHPWANQMDPDTKPTGQTQGHWG